MKNKLYLIPSHLSDNTFDKYGTSQLQTVINQTNIYVVENEKSARKFLKEAGIKTLQKDLRIFSYGKHERKDFNIKEVFDLMQHEGPVGLMSEAGCPAIADPGADIVAEAHRRNIQVVPLIGPSSILMSLMASGLNGQSFSFWGYLPIDKKEKKRKIKELEALSEKFNQTQIFIETPFRNDSLFEDLLKNCSSNTQLCIAKDLSSDEEWIRTKSIHEWGKDTNRPLLHKIPCVFLMKKSK